MTAVLLGDALGPKAKRRVTIVSVVAGVAVAGGVFLALRRLQERGQLSAALWKPFTTWPVLKFFLTGLATTMKVAAVAMVLAVAVGALMALGRLARNAPTRWMAGIYVELFRALPLLLMIYFSARGLPKLGIHLGAFWFAVLPLVAYNSAVLGEIFRAGILSLERGQMEAASAIGLSYWQAMRLVILPQAVRRMIPSLVSQLVTLLKDTSLASVIPLQELLRNARIYGESRFNPLVPLVFAAAIYFVINLALSRLARRLEVRQRSKYNAGSISVAGAGEDLVATDVAASARLSK